MGNSVPIVFLCCKTNKDYQIKDIDINKNSNEYLRNYKTIKISNNNIKKKEIQKNNIKKMQTFSKYSSANGCKNILNQDYYQDSASYKDANISLFNNTFQILNNTQQYISFPNMITFKNNLINNQFMKSFYNSKFDSAINCSKINSNVDDNLANINIKLILTGELFLDKKIVIDKNGMKNRLRKTFNGVTIFGYSKNNIIPNEPLYDYYFDYDITKIKNNFQNNNKEKNKGKVFEIFLDKNEKKYILYYVHKSFYLYYKINDKLFFDIDKDYYLILGDIYLTINIKRSINSNAKIINIEVELDEDTKKYTFNQKDVPIKIGRVNCSIDIPKSSISKLHSIIDFSNNTFLYKDAESTNGSTLLIKEDDIIKIQGEMNFKLEDVPFTIEEIIIDKK